MSASRISDQWHTLSPRLKSYSSLCSVQSPEYLSDASFSQVALLGKVTYELKTSYVSLISTPVTMMEQEADKHHKHYHLERGIIGETL